MWCQLRVNFNREKLPSRPFRCLTGSFLLKLNIWTSWMILNLQHWNKNLVVKVFISSPFQPWRGQTSASADPTSKANSKSKSGNGSRWESRQLAFKAKVRKPSQCLILPFLNLVVFIRLKFWLLLIWTITYKRVSIIWLKFQNNFNSHQSS